MKECSIQLWSYHSPCAAHLAETGQERTIDNQAVWNNKTLLQQDDFKQNIVVH